MKRIAILLLVCLSNGWLFANHWTPNNSSYEDNMTLTGVIQSNGVEQQLTTLEVGVFCGEECRGSGYPTYFLPTQRYVIQLLIFGEPGDQLTFKLFDSDLGQELDLVSPDAVTFVSNGYGTLFAPYVLNFTGSDTHWVPNQSSYEDNMTLTGVIQINGVEQQSTTLEVGVFCGTECRGTGLATYFLPTQRYMVQLLIFGEAGNRFTFKLYDHALGQELNLTSPNAVTFTTNGYGTLLNPYVLNFTGSVPESYPISASANPEEGGTIEGAGYYLGGQTCTLTAIANEGYAFKNWTEGGTVVSTTPIYAFSVTSSRTLIANFTSTGGNHWVPNQSSYEDNMTLTGVIQINGVEQQSTTLEVGVFCGEECRGTDMATYFFPTQRYVVQLLIFGETGDQLTFKLYDHALGQELNLTSPDAVTFTANGYGTLGNPYVLDFTGEMDEITQTTNLSQGWNWWSTYIEVSDPVSMLDILKEGLGNNAVQIQSTENMTEYDGEDWFGDLDDLGISNEQTYLIEMGAPCTVALQGMPANPVNHVITINHGWNWIGFPSAEPMDVVEAFAGFEAEEEDQIMSQNGMTEFDGEEWFGDLETLEPGQGLMYFSNSTETKTLIYQTGTKQGR